MFAIDRAGLVGADGATHQGAYDFAYLRCVPNMIILAPSDENECRQMLFTAFQHGGPSAVRYPRGAGTGVEVKKDLVAMPIGQAEIKRSGKRIALLAFGSMVAPSMLAGEALDATVVNMRFVKPLDEAMLLELARSHEAFVTVEEHVIMGGAGSAVAEAMAKLGIVKPLLNLGFPDRFIDHGEQGALLKLEGLDGAGIEQSVRQRFADNVLAGVTPRLVVNR